MLVRVLGCACAHRSWQRVYNATSRGVIDDGPHLVLFTTQITIGHACREMFRAPDKLSNPSSVLSSPIFVTWNIHTGNIYGFFPPLRRSFRGYFSSLFIAETWSFSGSTETLEGDEINVSFPRTYSVGKCVRVMWPVVATRYKYASVFVPHSYVRLCSYVRWIYIGVYNLGTIGSVTTMTSDEIRIRSCDDVDNDGGDRDG